MKHIIIAIIGCAVILTARLYEAKADHYGPYLGGSIFKEMEYAVVWKDRNDWVTDTEYDIDNKHYLLTDNNKRYIWCTPKPKTLVEPIRKQEYAGSHFWLVRIENGGCAGRTGYMFSVYICSQVFDPYVRDILESCRISQAKVDADREAERESSRIFVQNIQKALDAAGN